MLNTKKYRRDLHKIPEIGYKEYETQKYLIKAISSMGFNPIKICNTGVYVFIDVQKEESIAYRSDIDALKIIEETNHDFKSLHEGYMHACGHDGHMAMLLGFLEHLSNIDLSKYNKNILCIFQPAEEGPGGALDIIKAGLFEKYNVVSIFGIHLFPEYDEGTVATKSGYLMSSANEINIDIYGKSTHIAIPEKGVDSIYVTSKLLSTIKDQVEEEVTPYEDVILGFGKIRGGSTRNIISDHTKIEGTIRTISKKALDDIKNIINRTINDLEKKYNANIKMDILYGYPSVNNDSNLFDRVKNLNLDNFLEVGKPFKIAEDFSFYQQKIPGIFMFLGTKNEDLNHIYPLHNKKFNFNDSVLDIGVKVYLKILNSYNE